MTVSQFSVLTDDQKANLVYSEGVLIGLRKTFDCRILLYQLHGFYVEIWYQPSRNIIRNFLSFTSTDRLDPYLRKLSLEGITG
ncbi:MAG TPA: hypothetical protein VFZ78_10720 [Flavisolibacter sp.]